VGIVRHWILGVIILIYNIIDGLFTHYYLQHNLIEEANPLMNWMINDGWLTFWFIKLLLPIIGCAILIKYQHKWLAKFGLWFLSITYMSLIGYHIYGWVYLI
jgi:cytochrome b561